MKNIGIIIIIYNVLCLSIINSDWYAKYYDIVDFCDIPLYIGLAVVTLQSILNNKLLFWQLYPIIGSWLLLSLKLNQLYNPIDAYIFWNWVLVVLVGILIIDEKYNQ